MELILTDYTLRIVAVGSAFLGIMSGVLGSFAVIRKESLLGDAVSHSALPGIALAFLLTNNKNTEVLLLGALLSGLLATFLILFIIKYSKIKFDSSLALILSVFFGIGMVLLTYIQKSPNANQAGLEKFIFGQASTLLKRDVIIMGVTGFILLSLVILFWKEIKLVSFDGDYAESLGFSRTKVTILLFGMMVVTIIIGLQTVGVILMSAMLTSPGVAARQWTDKLSVMVILSAIFGAISGILGTILSSLASKLPTGPMIVIVISGIVILSLTFAPNRGLIYKFFRDRKRKKEINEDQILANLYYLAINHNDIQYGHDVSTIKLHKDTLNKSDLETTKKLEDLGSRGLVKKDPFNKWSLTPKGLEYVEEHFGKEDL